MYTHSVEISKILSHPKKFSWNQIFSNLFSKTVAFTKFSSEKCEREFTKFPHCVLWTIHYYLLTKNSFLSLYTFAIISFLFVFVHLFLFSQLFSISKQDIEKAPAIWKLRWILSFIFKRLTFYYNFSLILHSIHKFKKKRHYPMYWNVNTVGRRPGAAKANFNFSKIDYEFDFAWFQVT